MSNSVQKFPIDNLKVYNDIASGAKVFEGRTPNSRMASVKDGELVEFCNGTKSCIVRIKGRQTFSSIEDMLTSLGVKKMLPYLSNEPDCFDLAVEAYKKWRLMGGHPENGETVAIEFELTKTQ